MKTAFVQPFRCAHCMQSLIAAKTTLRERNLFRTGIVALVLRFHPEHKKKPL